MVPLRMMGVQRTLFFTSPYLHLCVIYDVMTQGWTGGVTASVNGVAVTGWRCVPFGKSQDPETVYPGSTFPQYDDSAWTDPIVSLFESIAFI
jgi:hypothetical protein